MRATEIEPPPPPRLLLSLIPESRNFLSPPKKSKEILPTLIRSEEEAFVFAAAAEFSFVFVRGKGRN